MGTSPTIHLCDHRAASPAEWLAALRALGGTVASSTRLLDSAEALGAQAPDLVILDPLVEAGEAEIQLVLSGRESPAPALLYLVDAELREAALEVLSRHPSACVDLAPRSASAAEIVWRAERLLALRRSKVEVEELRHRALFDDRTEVLRPKAFEQRLVEHFSAAERHHFGLALVLLDLDRFGQFNKLRDHTFGDLVIARVGAVIRRNLRAEDIAGRLGGDEFAVVLPYTGPVEAAHVVRRLRDEIHALTGALVGPGSELTVAASLGFETFDGNDLESVGSLRAHAEQALHAAKRAGGDRGVYYRSLMAEGPRG